MFRPQLIKVLWQNRVASSNMNIFTVTSSVWTQQNFRAHAARAWDQKISSEAMHVYMGENRPSLWSCHIGDAFKSIELSFDIYKVSNHHLVHDTIDSRYIAVQYNTILHTVQQLRRQNFGQTSNSWKTAIPRPSGRAMTVSHELLGGKWPQDIRSSLYPTNTWQSTQFIQISMNHNILPFIAWNIGLWTSWCTLWWQMWHQNDQLFQHPAAPLWILQLPSKCNDNVPLFGRGYR